MRPNLQIEIRICAMNFLRNLMLIWTQKIRESVPLSAGTRTVYQAKTTIVKPAIQYLVFFYKKLIRIIFLPPARFFSFTFFIFYFLDTLGGAMPYILNLKGVHFLRS